MPSNLWPDFQIEQAVKSPKTVIEQLGAGLQEKTEGLVKFVAEGMRIKEDMVNTTFNLYSPKLGYHYPFLSISFPVDSFYPVTLVADKIDVLTANDEGELTKALTTIFNSPSTRNTIQKLMTLASNG